MNPEKICPKHNDGAGALLPASDFYVITNRQGKPALAGYCKECSKSIAKSYHKQHPEKARAAVIASLARHPETASKKYPSQQEWRRRDTEQNPEKYLSRYRKHQLKRFYGLTQEWYDAKLLEQGGHCALCSKTESSGGRSLHIDHCHVTGQIRGLLCDRCNNCLERIETYSDWPERAREYLGVHKENPDKRFAAPDCHKRTQRRKNRHSLTPHETHPRTALHN